MLSGGGARGFAHVGALLALEHMGLRPAAIVGVSMGAVVGATYALNPDWYAALVDMDISGFPAVPDFSVTGVTRRLQSLYQAEKFVSSSWYGWGIGEATYDWGIGVLKRLTLEKALEDGRIPVCITATDLADGKRVAFCEGLAWERVYASSALAGILPPAKIDRHLLVDGGYSDIAPIGLARRLVNGPVIAIDASRNLHGALPTNGMQAMLRGLEICQNEHATLRFSQADLVLQPRLDPPLGTLEFAAKRRAVAAGARMVHREKDVLRRLISDGTSSGSHKGSHKT
ncbi:hypothetical protein ATO11_04070 [Pseudaestuariivita atlantica]|uniref:PNPLA domain-containing protein n=1 Tax=Pseudaestuariivita atlantica TaxID=1317121 RepID=A0A0L1JS19_9RHOB|nr:hypothetical protein ATO11_04070 [Pseudaestuariivita atlantica]